MSSTFFDLKEERSAIVMALLEMDAFPAGMELFPAADEDAWTLIKRVIDTSDYYLLVIGGRYGSVDPQTELSYTEMEYDYAIQQGKPVMAFLHENPEKIELGKSEKDTATRKKLEAFREKVTAAKHVKFWDGADDLAGKVARSYATIRKNYDAIGWVRGDAQTSPETLSELNDLRKRLEEAEAQIPSRAADPPPGSERFSQGNEKVTFPVTWQVSARLERTYEYDDRNYSGSIETEFVWDELFSLIGPDLLNEAPETQLEKRIDAYLEERFAEEAFERAEKEMATEQYTPSEVLNISVQIRTDDFKTVIVQLRAIGLIERSERPRSVKDIDTYWTLTPFGDQHLTTLRAIRREPVKE